MKSIYSISNKINFYAECKKIYFKNPNSDLYIFHDNNLILNQEYDNDEIIIANPSVFSSVNPHNNIVHDTVVLPQKYAKILLNYNEKAALFVPNLFLYLINKLDLPYKYLTNINNSELEQDLTIVRSLKKYFDSKNYSPVSYGYLESLTIFGDSIFVRKILPSSNINELLSFKHSNKNSTKCKIAFCFLMRTKHNQPKVWEKFFKNETDYKVYVHTTEYIVLDWDIPHKIVLQVDSKYLYVNKVYEQLMSFAINDDPSLTHFIFLSESCVPIKSMSTVREICIKDKSLIEEIDESEYEKNKSINIRLNTALTDLFKSDNPTLILPDQELYLHMNKHKPHFILCKKDVEKFLKTSSKYKEFYQKIPSGNEHFLSYLNLKTQLKKSNIFYMKWDSSYLSNKYNKLLIDIENKYKQYYLGLDKPVSLCDPIIIDYLLGLYKPVYCELNYAMNPSTFFYYITLYQPYGFWNILGNAMEFINGRFVDKYIDYWSNKLKIIKYYSKNNIPKALKFNDHLRVRLIHFPQHIVLHNFLKKIILNPENILYFHPDNPIYKQYQNRYPSLRYFYPKAKYTLIPMKQKNIYNKYNDNIIYDIIVEVIALKGKIECFDYKSKFICLLVRVGTRENDYGKTLYEQIKHYEILFMKLESNILIIVLNKNKKRANNELYKKIKDIIEDNKKENIKQFNNALNLLIKDLEESKNLDIKKHFIDTYQGTLDFYKKYQIPLNNKFLNLKFH